MRIDIPQNAEYIINTLEDAGYEAYVVGGCVRDSILGRTPQDWDITTSAKPEQVKALFPRTLDTGLQHGTVTVMMDKEGYEITTYRIDGEYEDGRHPKEVIFTPNLEEDLKRRDFTINAMAYNHKNGLIDIFGGVEDIDRKVIRCVGDPMERFGEDALRMLRAVRFSAQLGYIIDESTRQGIQKLAPTLEKISAERIQTELVKTLVSNHPDYLRDAYQLGITGVFLPELDIAMKTEQNHKHHMYTVGEHILHSLTAVRADKMLRLTMLFHDLGKPQAMTVDEEGVTHFHGHARISAEMAVTILRRLKFDNDTIRKVKQLVLYHDYINGIIPDMRILRRAVNRVGEDNFAELLEVSAADIAAQSDYKRAEKEANLTCWRNKYEELLAAGQCVSLKGLAVTGADLIEIGMKPGKEIGEMLQFLLECVLEDPECNTKDILLAKAVRKK